MIAKIYSISMCVILWLLGALGLGSVCGVIFSGSGFGIVVALMISTLFIAPCANLMIAYWGKK